MVPILSALFPPDVRARGNVYHARGRVVIRSVADGVAVGMVTGSDTYELRVALAEGSEPALSCSCRYFADRGPCKHLWAMLLELERTTDFLQSAADGSAFLSARTQRAGSANGAKPPAWQRALANAGRSMAAESSRAEKPEWPPNRKINYIIDATATLDGREGLIVELATQVVDKYGHLGPPRRMTQSHEQWLANPDPLDRHIAQMLIGTRAEFSWYQPPAGRRYVIPESAYDTTLRSMCETGRCRIRRTPHEAQPATLTWDTGEPWSLVLQLEPAHPGDAAGASSSASAETAEARREGQPEPASYTVTARLRREDERTSLDDVTLLLRGGLFVAGNVIAPFRHYGAFDLITAIRTASPVTVSRGEVRSFLMGLYSLPQVPPLILPPELAIEEVRRAPTPRLAITSVPARAGGPAQMEVDLSFDYSGTTIRAEHGHAALFQADGPRIIYRDHAAEELALDRLLSNGVKREFDYYARAHQMRIAPARVDALVHELVGEGWHVEVKGQLLRGGSALQAEIRSGVDWFDLDASVEFDEISVPLPRLLSALSRGERTIALEDGSVGVIPDATLARLRSLASIGKETNGELRFARAQAAMLDTLVASLAGLRVDDPFEKARAQLRRFDRITPADAPEGFTGTLRPYQNEGLGWMHFLRDFGFGGCLADDMGLGKTVQVLALLEARRAAGAGPSLVVVPKSLIFNWRQESARFTPSLRVLEYTGDQRDRAAVDPAAHDLVLTTYGVLRRDSERLAAIGFDYAILDEAQAIKNATTAGAKAARLLNARHRLALTGTPVENRIGDLWSLFEFLNPGMLGAARGFSAAGTGETIADQGTRELLARALRPFILRRTKQQVASDLPERLEQTIYVELEAEERAQYDELRDHYRASLLNRIAIDGMNKSRMHVLEALLRLRQAACHPGLIDRERVTETSSKLDVLVPRLLELAAEDHKVIVFSQFTSFLAILRTRLDEEGLPYAYLDGRTRDREAKVEQFQTDPNCRAFLISLKAGGLGLNLTAAEYVFLLDPWWNPAVEAQAIDRAHRIGQTRRVFASRLIARDTVEEKVLELQRTKRDLADAIITGDNASVRNLRREDLEVLLS